ncbi:MAG: hypothetical protein AAB388_02075 [Patescibacteria group bacterium]|mgnify:CR=1 FL=1
MFDEPKRLQVKSKELVLFDLPKTKLTVSMRFTSSGWPTGYLDLCWKRCLKKERPLIEKLTIDDGIYMGMLRIGQEHQRQPGPYVHIDGESQYVNTLVHLRFPNAVCEFELDLKRTAESEQFLKNCGLR